MADADSLLFKLLSSKLDDATWLDLFEWCSFWVSLFDESLLIESCNCWAAFVVNVCIRTGLCVDEIFGWWGCMLLLLFVMSEFIGEILIGFNINENVFEFNWLLFEFDDDDE